MRPAQGGYDAAREAQAVAKAAAFLDEATPLAYGRYADVTGWRVEGGVTFATVGGVETGLQYPSQLVGHSGSDEKRSILLRNNGLHIELVFDRAHPVGAASASGLRDVVLETALTAIQDCEDSIVSVDAKEKVLAYSNWLGLTKGDLAESFQKGDKTLTRRQNADRSFTTPEGGSLTLQGRAVLLMRNVGHLMTTDAVLLDGQEVPEGLMDAMVTVTATLHDLRQTGGDRNSRAGPVLPKAEFKVVVWLSAYEAGNVDAGLATGIQGKGPIGKGMWAKPDAMAEMLTAKIGHPKAAESTAWAPSPTAATLHATHYH